MALGVMHRIEDLAKRPEGFEPARKVPFRKLAPLEEIIAEAFGIGKTSKKVENEYHDLINRFGSEFDILMELDIGEIAEASNSQVAEALRRVREGKVNIDPGYDGEYGKIRIFDDKEREIFSSQKSLF
jgi:PHP family Zn ribbon phosphoesterase